MTLNGMGKVRSFPDYRWFLWLNFLIVAFVALQQIFSEPAKLSTSALGPLPMNSVSRHQDARHEEDRVDLESKIKVRRPDRSAMKLSPITQNSGSGVAGTVIQSSASFRPRGGKSSSSAQPLDSLFHVLDHPTDASVIDNVNPDDAAATPGMTDEQIKPDVRTKLLDRLEVEMKRNLEGRVGSNTASSVGANRHVITHSEEKKEPATMVAPEGSAIEARLRARVQLRNRLATEKRIASAGG
jgi:hypothetical protein